MIEIETVLVLGAGASIPFGFPSGQNLVDIICTKLLSHSLNAKLKWRNYLLTDGQESSIS